MVFDKLRSSGKNLYSKGIKSMKNTGNKIASKLGLVETGLDEDILFPEALIETKSDLVKLITTKEPVDNMTFNFHMNNSYNSLKSGLRDLDWDVQTTNDDKVNIENSATNIRNLLFYNRDNTNELTGYDSSLNTLNETIPKFRYDIATQVIPKLENILSESELAVEASHKSFELENCKLPKYEADKCDTETTYDFKIAQVSNDALMYELLQDLQASYIKSADSIDTNMPGSEELISSRNAYSSDLTDKMSGIISKYDKGTETAIQDLEADKVKKMDSIDQKIQYISTLQDDLVFSKDLVNTTTEQLSIANQIYGGELRKTEDMIKKLVEYSNRKE